MKNWSLKAALTLLSAASLVACSASEQEVNKRGDRKADLVAFNQVLRDQAKNSGDATPDSDKDKPADETPDSTEPVTPAVPEIKIPGLKFAADAALASIKADVVLVNKINATDIVLFGKEGKSWVYNPALAAADQLKAITPIVVNPVGSTLYSLPDNEFWFVSSDRLGRHKSGSAGMTGEEKTVTTEQFATAALKGDKAKIKVLYASVDEIILHLDTYIDIITIMPSPAPASIKQLEIAKLPVDLKGDVTAGRSAAGYWFRSAAGLFFLSKTNAQAPWSQSAFSVEPSDINSLAMYPDEAGLKFQGASLGLSAAGLFSDVTPAP